MAIKKIALASILLSIFSPPCLAQNPCRMDGTETKTTCQPVKGQCPPKYDLIQSGSGFCLLVGAPRLRTISERTPNFAPLETAKSQPQPKLAPRMGNPVAIASLRVDARSGLGYKPISFGGEIEGRLSFSPKVKADVSVFISRSQKTIGSGYSIGGTGALRFYLNQKTFILGGITARNQQTSYYSKTSVSPIVGIGQTVAPFEWRAFYEFPDFTSVNKVQGGGFQFDYFRPSSKRWGLYVGGGGVIRHFGCIQGVNGLTQTCVGAVGTLKVGIYLKRAER